MQYTLTTGTAPDLAVIEDTIAALDPAVLLDLDRDGHTIRISTCVTQAELVACLHTAGVPDPVRHLVQVPSVCCGGCSG